MRPLLRIDILLTRTNQPLFVASHTITEMDAKKAIKLTPAQICRAMSLEEIIIYNIPEAQIKQICKS
jgi:hypothetical protein